jgi:exoribonuclease R
MAYLFRKDGFYCSKTFEKIEIVLDTTKLFINDSVDETGNIVYSPTRSNTYLPGVLDLRITFGKDGKKFIYMCYPDDKRLPHFLIAYDIPYSFDKNHCCLYVTFQYKNWEHDYPRGILTQTIGDVNESSNFYEYILYCKSLNVSIQKFTKEAIKQLKQYPPNNIIPLSNAKVFTIDSNNSIDLDDGLSIDVEKVSIYISLVPFILDLLGLWTSFTTRISTIYMPDKKRPMLPAVLAQLCSLVEGTERCCLVMNLYHNGKKDINITRVNIVKNFCYESEELLSFPDYIKLHKLTKHKNSHELVNYYMVKFNTISASIIKKGIHKTIHKPDIPSEIVPAYYKQYSTYEYHGNYIQITSPIRRLVDIMNMYQLCNELNLITFSKDAQEFYDKWYNKLDYLNISMRHIRQAQNKGILLHSCEQHQHKHFKGYVFNKIEHSIGYKYNVYLTELKISCNFTHKEVLEEYSLHEFKIYVFHHESSLKKKIKLQLIM